MHIIEAETNHILQDTRKRGLASLTLSKTKLKGNEAHSERIGATFLGAANIADKT